MTYQIPVLPAWIAASASEKAAALWLLIAHTDAAGEQQPTPAELARAAGLTGAADLHPADEAFGYLAELTSLGALSWVNHFGAMQDPAEQPLYTLHPDGDAEMEPDEEDPDGEDPDGEDPGLDEPLLDPDCRDGKCGSCIGGPCEHGCHTPAPALTRADRPLLSDVLPEPADGTTMVLTGRMICGHLVIVRDDQRAADAGYEHSRWYRVDHSRGEPQTWASFTTYATRAWDLGEPLIDLGDDDD